MTQTTQTTQTAMLLVQESLFNFTIDEAFIKRFYWRFFALEPEAKPLFNDAIDKDTYKFKAVFEIFASGAQNIENMRISLNNLGAYHADKQVKFEHFASFKKALLSTLGDEIGELFTAETEAAWNEYMDKIIDYMHEGMIGTTAMETTNDQHIIQEFKDAGAMLSGHFILSSGLRSATYLQCARVMMDARRGERLCSALASKLQGWMQGTGIKIDAIVAPAMGGVVVGYEMGRQLDIDAMFCERVDGEFALRRGFELQAGQKILIVEDVVTTGKSSMEAVACVRANGAEAVAVASLIDRRGNNDVSLTLPLISLLKLDVPTYSPDNLPPELQAIPAIKLGSRGLKAVAG